jgi:hypothetical protein
MYVRCNICDKPLSEKEVSWNDDIKTFEPCTTCLDVALDAAYGQHRPDDEDILLDNDFDVYQDWSDITADYVNEELN